MANTPRRFAAAGGCKENYRWRYLPDMAMQSVRGPDSKDNAANFDSLLVDRLPGEQMPRMRIRAHDDLLGLDRPPFEHLDVPPFLAVRALRELLDGRPGEKVHLARGQRGLEKVRCELVWVDGPRRAARHALCVLDSGDLA